MKFSQWLLSNWFILLAVGIAIVAVYLAYLTNRTLHQVSSEPDKTDNSDIASAETHNLKRYRHLSSIKTVLGFILFILIVSSLTFSILKNRTSQSEPPKVPILTAEISGTASYGDNLYITLDKIIPMGDSSYKVDATVRNGKGEESIRFSNAKEGATITFPQENGYDIKIVRIDSRSTSFAIKKN